MTDYDARVQSHEANDEELSAVVQRLVGTGLPTASRDLPLIEEPYRMYLIRKYGDTPEK